MSTCPDPDVLVEGAIDQVLTQYRESPNLLAMARSLLHPPADTAKLVCEILDRFDIETATADQLTIIGKWLGWPRCHCAGKRRTVFGFACEPLSSVLIVDGDGAIIVDCPPIITDPVEIDAFPVVVATVDEPYQAFIVTASGGLGPYVFSVAVGPLPPGITITTAEDGLSALVAGTPTSIGEYDVTLRATDTLDQTADLDEFTITVYE